MTGKPNTTPEPGSAAGKTLQQLLDERFANVPYLSAEEIVRRKREKLEKQREEELALAKERNQKILRLTPYGGPQDRKWRPYVDGVSAYRQHEPTPLEREVMRADSVAARLRRAQALSDPLNLYGSDEETMADVVRRQDETR